MPPKFGLFAAMLFVGMAGIAWELIRCAHDDGDHPTAIAIKEL